MEREELKELIREVIREEREKEAKENLEGMKKMVHKALTEATKDFNIGYE